MKIEILWALAGYLFQKKHALENKSKTEGFLSGMEFVEWCNLDEKYRHYARVARKYYR